MAGADISQSDEHPFCRKPNRTLLYLTIPVLFSMIAEPLTGLVDTAFVARLGAEPLAALGVGTITLSSLFWIFNFLSIGTQTEVSRALGADSHDRINQIAWLALLIAALSGFSVLVIFWPLTFSGFLSELMGTGADSGELTAMSIGYMTWRLLGAPAVLISFAGFGVLRGLQEMRLPLYVAFGQNLLNLILDPILIFGLYNAPALGVEGSAIATIISQWAGAFYILHIVRLRVGPLAVIKTNDAGKLLKVGGDLFVRTGLLSFFLLLATRYATAYGSECGAAHQAIRQFWIFSALFLDSFAVSGQSLIGYFLGAGDLERCRRVASLVCIWSFVMGFFIGGVMLLAMPQFISLLVPPTAAGVFVIPWIISALWQPVNALAFATDGIHWGTGDFAYLRNVMILSTATCVPMLMSASLVAAKVSIIDPLSVLWVSIAVWIAVRAIFGFLRIFPGIGQAPLRLS